MILVPMREHEPEEILSFLDQKADIGEDEVDAGEILAGERDAEIDRDPLPAPLVAEPIDREIHADLAGPAERREDKLVGSDRHQLSPLGGAGGKPAPSSAITSP